MKVLLLVGGVLFLLLAFLLLAAAVIVFFVARSRRNRAAAPAVQPVAPAAPAPVAHATPPPPPPPPPAPAPAAAPAPAPRAESAFDETVMVDATQIVRAGALHGTGGALAGRVFPIDPAGFYVGRDRTLSQVVIEHPSVSKRHLWVGLRDGAVVAIDQSSTNGTYLNGGTSRITEARLAPGDTLIISDDVARLEYRA